MFNEFIEYINKFMNPAELVFTFFGLICIIAIWIAGRKIWERAGTNKRNKEGGIINVFRTSNANATMDWRITRANEIYCKYDNICADFRFYV